MLPWLMYKIFYTKTTLKTLKKLPRNVQMTLRQKIELLAENPYAANNNVKKLQGIDGYRLRVGDWRIIYDIYDKKLVIEVIKIDSRGGVYQ